MAIQEIRITPCFEAKILNAKLDCTCLGIISAWIERLHIATHVWNVSQIIYMHNPNLVVYLINPKTFTSLRGGKIVNNDGNPTFKFQIHFCIQRCICIKDSKSEMCMSTTSLFVAITIIACCLLLSAIPKTF